MFKQKIILAGMLAAVLPGAALAADEVTMHKEDKHVIPPSAHTLTGNAGLFSQYIFRGLTQTNEKPALQGGFDYSHSAGFYAGVWGSNISWITDTVQPAPAGLSASLELDTYFGFKNSFADDFTYDVGFLRYNYPGSYPALFVKPDTNEIYGAIGYKWLTAKYSYSLGDTFGFAQARGTDYLDISANFPVADTGITLGAHVGKQSYKGTNAALWGASGCTNKCLDYTDYKLGVSKDFSGYVVGLAFTNTNAKAFAPDGVTAIYQNGFGKNIGRSETVLSVSKTF